MDAPAAARHPDHDGQAIATARKARGLTQGELARRATISLSLLRKIEQGDRSLTSGVRAALTRVLGRLPVPDASSPGRIAAALPLLRDVMDGYDLPPDPPTVPVPAAELRHTVETATRWRLESRYAELAGLLPGLIPDLTVSALASVGRQREQGFALLALAYRAVDAIADKHGYRDMSARAIELTRWAAAQSGDPLLGMMAAYVRAELFFDGTRARTGLRILDSAAASPPPERHTAMLAMYGALQMRAAVLAARAGMAAEATDRMAEARTAANRVPDAVYTGTAFGPSSVRVHELATAVEASDIPSAMQLISHWQPPSALPAERRSHFHIEAARTHLWAGEPDQAIESIWAARHAAPQHTRANSAAIHTVQAIIQAKRRPSASLLQLANWLGITQRTLPVGESGN